MDSEVTSLKEHTSDKKTTVIAGMEFIEGTLRGRSVVIVKCGVGKVNAGICANTLINNFGCTRIINTGVAGSLNNDINIGDIVVSVDAVQHDIDATALGFEKGEIPYTDMRVFSADAGLRQAAVRAAKESAPDINVFEGFDWKSYGKGETIELGYASFTINRVDKEGISISSNEDLVYNGEIVHKLFLNKYDGCEIHSQNRKATIKLIGIEIQ